MKFKIKPAYIGIFLIGTMFVSTFAFVILQSVYYNPQQPKIELPTTNVVNSKISLDQQNFLLSQGRTIMTYQYSESCGYCLEQRQFLEQLTKNSKLSNQLFLEVLDSKNELPSLTLVSYYGQRDVANATQEEVIPALCQILVSKPVECALQQVQ